MGRKAKAHKSRRLRVRRRLALNSLAIRWTLALLCCVFAIYGIYFVGEVAFRHTSQVLQTAVSVVDPSVSLAFSRSTLRSYSTQELVPIERGVQRLANQPGGANAESIAALAHALLNPQSVLVYMGAGNRPTVDIVARVAAGMVRTDRLRLVSTEGVIYGEADVEKHAQLTEFIDFDHAAAAVPRTPADTHMSLEVRDSLRLAVSLLADLRGNHFSKVTSMRWIKHRGIEVVFANPSLRATFGAPPFDGQIRRLRDVLTKAEAGRKYADRVELDYNGKVFVKYRDM